ncbi:MAG: phospholipase D-like domain-containing protein [Pyrinomonadaceae bacterium]
MLCLIAVGRTTTVRAQERLCDVSFEDCRTPLINLIRAETIGIDVAWWFMEDSRYSTEIIKRWQAGVPVRIIIDPRANASYPINKSILDAVQAAGIPMRYKLKDGILHWKMMLFDGQGKVEFSSANYSPNAFTPEVPYSNYTDEVIYFTDDVSVVNSFRTKYDELWTNTSAYGNYANIAAGTTLLRRYATFAINSELNFPPGTSFADRAISAYRAEQQQIDVIMYRITDERHTNEMIAAVGRGVPVRLIHEPGESYRNTAYSWDSYNVDRMYMAGVQIKMRKHLGQTHEKLMLLRSQGMAVHASSNWSVSSANSQQEHNYFTKKGWFYQWYVNHFERKWNSAAEFEVFVPLPPETPVLMSPASGALGVNAASGVQLKWEGDIGRTSMTSTWGRIRRC